MNLLLMVNKKHDWKKQNTWITSLIP
jgi:hypothetical protein